MEIWSKLKNLFSLKILFRIFCIFKHKGVIYEQSKLYLDFMNLWQVSTTWSICK